MPCELLLASCLSIIGPGAIAYSPVLEAVAERRVLNDWGLTDDWRGYEVLVAVADCNQLGRSGWLIANGNVYSAIAVDCQQAKHRGQMESRGILVDASPGPSTTLRIVRGLNHELGWLVLR